MIGKNGPVGRYFFRKCTKIHILAFINILYFCTDTEITSRYLSLTYFSVLCKYFVNVEEKFRVGWGEGGRVTVNTIKVISTNV